VHHDALQRGTGVRDGTGYGSDGPVGNLAGTVPPVTTPERVHRGPLTPSDLGFHRNPQDPLRSSRGPVLRFADPPRRPGERQVLDLRSAVRNGCSERFDRPATAIDRTGSVLFHRCGRRCGRPSKQEAGSG
jgi:hypothetical protein